MAKRGVKLRAVLEWAKVFKENRDLTGYKPNPTIEGSYESTDGACTVNIILDGENVELLKATGFARTFKNDPEGRGQMVKVDRKFNTGYDFSSGAPSIFNADTNEKWTFDDGELGNGTIADVYLSVYDTKYGTIGSRIDRIDVLDHVEHGGGGSTVYDSVSASPKPTPSTSAPEDEIPF